MTARDRSLPDKPQEAPSGLWDNESTRGDFDLSPFTGLTREHWKRAALKLLEGAFSVIRDMNDPMQFPKQAGVSYPRNEGQIPVEKLEGLCRTLFLAVPLLKENPALEINRINVAAYYRHHLSELTNPLSQTFIPPRKPAGRPKQNLVEFGTLSLLFFIAPEILWEPLSSNSRDSLAATMLSYGEGPTIPTNWMFFNVMILSFFKSCSYQVDESRLEHLLEEILGHYRGDGWYSDDTAYNYYSMWSFQTYGLLWAVYYGKKNHPAIASRFLDNFKPVPEHYPQMFSRNGEMIMWGRSITYRFAAATPLALTGFTAGADINFGWMRRIASGTLLQFLRHPSFLREGVPALGFYGPFEPAVQRYSCRGSSYWCGKLFQALLLPPDNPFWSAIENQGPWDSGSTPGTVHARFLEKPEILLVDYPDIGASEIRAGCHFPVTGAKEAFRGSENYNRLSYNSAFPWQADGPKGEVAMNYAVQKPDRRWEPFRLFDFREYRQGCYYRDARLESDPRIRLQLTDIPLPNGILRIDRNISSIPCRLRLGHYALPETGKPVKKVKRKVKGCKLLIVANTRYQLALVPVTGWDKLIMVKSGNLHPEARKSAVINVLTRYNPKKMGRDLHMTLMLWKKAGESWSDDELMPIRDFSLNGSDGTIYLNFISGRRITVSFPAPVTSSLSSPVCS